jgi:alanine-synthesizing transaminase
VNNIYTGNGVSELIQLSMNALLDDGDEILIPGSGLSAVDRVRDAGGRQGGPLHLRRAGGLGSGSSTISRARSRTARKAIVVINPNNPTGAVYPKDLLEQIVEIARENELMIFCDEIYDRLVMDDIPYTSIASLAPDVFCVTFSGLSKSHMIAGYRVGWMVLSGNLDADAITSRV